MQNQQFRFLSFKEWVPDGLRFWIYLLFLACFQFSNGMYFSAMGQMSGGLSITMNDVRMMSAAMFAGLTMYFPLAFRLKMCFTNRTGLMCAAAGLSFCNLCAPHINNPLLFVLLCFAAGFLRLWGTFECLSSILPKIAPTFNYAVFLSFVFFVVLGVVHLFDLAGAYLIYYYPWQYLHYLAIILMGAVLLGAFLLMRPYRQMPKLPLLGVDWLGLILWSIFILALIFAAEYGNQLDWLNSPKIRIALGAACISLGFNIARIAYFRHPFLDLPAFKTRNLLNLLVLFALLSILLSGKTILQNAFISLLPFGTLNTANLNFFEFLGALPAAVFCWFAITKIKLPFKLLTFLGMLFVIFYSLIMFFLISPDLKIESLYLPLMCYGFGHVTVFITLTVYAQATAPFKNYFQVLCILGLIRTGIGSPAGEALFSRALQGVMTTNLASVEVLEKSLNANFRMIYEQALLAGVRELFGWTVIFGVFVLILICFAHFKGKIKRILPSLKAVYKAVRKEAQS